MKGEVLLVKQQTTHPAKAASTEQGVCTAQHDTQQQSAYIKQLVSSAPTKQCTHCRILH